MTTHDRTASPGGTIRPGTHPHAREEFLALLERERVRDPDALPLERSAPEPAEHIAGALPTFRPITQKRAARNRVRLTTALHEADPRHGRRSAPIPARTAPTSRTSLQSTRPADGGRSALTSTT